MPSVTEKEPKDYPFIRAWCGMMGSYQYYIDRQLEDARAENAPALAYTKNDEGGWKTVDTLASDSWRETLEKVTGLTIPKTRAYFEAKRDHLRTKIDLLEDELKAYRTELSHVLTELGKGQAEVREAEDKSLGGLGKAPSHSHWRDI